ncbi:PP2C family protein-serine/threonine phosphatase [[Mycoplasma] collis]|uniref:PP2C family protein-serine/threonine phosphatase n=1 Tax=[Mycoplasma] collis TaxID=2127 RepID=UPI00051B55DE|nr:protein phosphatase 2C domain-containing protein [[Mycoplasma] collis]
MKFKAYSEKGERNENQDKSEIFETENNILMILCDGMGGHFGGQKASDIAINEFKKTFFDNIIPPADENEVKKWFTNNISNVTSAMIEFAKKHPNYHDMGTTLVSILIYKKEKKAYIANVGDSRAYCVDDTLIQLTTDQNYLNHLIKKENYDFETASKIKGAHYLMSSLGPDKKLELEFLTIDNIDDYKYFLLTSDGIHDFINYNEFEALLISSGFSLKKQCEKIVEKALKSNSNDNLTIALLRL